MNSPVRISISEAAKFFGVSSQTIRKAIKEQKISYIVVRGRYQLNFESVLKWSQKSNLITKKFQTHGIGQYASQWGIKNPLYSPNPKRIRPDPNIRIDPNAPNIPNTSGQTTHS